MSKKKRRNRNRNHNKNVVNQNTRPATQKNNSPVQHSEKTTSPSAARAPIASTPSTSTQNNRKKKNKKWHPILLAILIMVALFVGLLMTPIQKAHRLFEKNYSHDGNGFYTPIVKLDEDTIFPVGSRIVGDTIRTEPESLKQGILDAKNGETTELAQFAAQYEVEKTFVDFKFDVMDNIGGRNFNRRDVWEAAVYTFWTAYFENSDDYNEFTLNHIRSTLIWLLS